MSEHVNQIATTTEGFWAARRRKRKPTFFAECESAVAALWPIEQIRELWAPKILGQTKNGSRLDDAVKAAEAVIAYGIEHDIKTISTANTFMVRRAVSKILRHRGWSPKQRLLTSDVTEMVDDIDEGVVGHAD